MEYFLSVLGMVMIVEGLPYFGFPDKMKHIMAYMREQDDGTLRFIGGIMMFVGLMIIFFARGGFSAL